MEYVVVLIFSVVILALGGRLYRKALTYYQEAIALIAILGGSAYMHYAGAKILLSFLWREGEKSPLSSLGYQFGWGILFFAAALLAGIVLDTCNSHNRR